MPLPFMAACLHIFPKLVHIFCVDSLIFFKNCPNLAVNMQSKYGYKLFQYIAWPEELLNKICSYDIEQEVMAIIDL